MAAIPVNLVTGFLGAGKTSAIRHLLAQPRGGENWAVLVNEFGEVGVDGALMARDGVAIEQVAGGCLCCVAAPLFTTGLNRLIRRARPDRIVIEPSGLGHPAQVLATLGGPAYAGVLETRATVCLMDARHLASTPHREHPNFVDQVHLADVLVANKADLYTPADLSAWEDFLRALDPPKARLAVTTHGRFDPAWLDLGRDTARQAAFPEAHAFLVDTTAPAAQGARPEWWLAEGEADGYYRAGWLVDGSFRWPLEELRCFVDALAAERRKGLLRTDIGWFSVNQADWQAAHRPADGCSRLELLDRSRPPSGQWDEILRSLAIRAREVE